MASDVVTTGALLRGLRWSYRRYGIKGAVAFLLGAGAVAYLWRRIERRSRTTSGA